MEHIMSDFDQNVFPGRESNVIWQTASLPAPGKSSLVNIVKTIALLGILLLMGCSSLSFLTATPSSDQTATVAVGQTPTPVLATPPPALEQATAAPAGGASMGDSLPAATKPEPQIGEITFALGATADRQPVNPGLLFTTGITEIHAIFTYPHMLPAYTWERVWYINDQEVSRSSAAWTGPENGVFDYFINTGDQPLLADDWILELYVEGKLRSLGVFIIEDTE